MRGAATVIDRHGSTAQKETIFPRIAAGEHRIALSFTEPGEAMGLTPGKRANRTRAAALLFRATSLVRRSQPMSRRFAVLVAAVVLAVTAGAALAKPPGGGPQPKPGLEPSDPLPASLCVQFPHPSLACSAVVVSCPSSGQSQVVCKTTGFAGPADAGIRRLALRLPRQYVKAGLVCAVSGDVSVRCKVVSRTLSTATGVRMGVVRLPKSFQSVRISCTNRSKLACTVKRQT